MTVSLSVGSSYHTDICYSIHLLMKSALISYLML